MRLPSHLLREIEVHGEEGYPYEICGFLIGRWGAEEVLETARARNSNTENPRRRYDIDPEDHIRVDRQARERGLDVVGFYHSHPDHPAQASATDAGRAVQGYYYVIVAVHGGRAVDANAFTAAPDGGPMLGEPLEVAD